MTKVREVFRSRAARRILLLTVILSLCMVFASAEGEVTVDTASITTSFTSGFNSIVSTSISLLSAMLPIALSLCAVLFIVKKGMSWFRGVAK